MQQKQTDVVIVGAGPAGIFTALEMLKKGSRQTITMIEKGLPVEKRRCPKAQTGRCMNCPSCAITTGVSGAGAFSDGKLSLSYEVGGDLPQLIGEDFAQRLQLPAGAVPIGWKKFVRNMGLPMNPVWWTLACEWKFATKLWNT